MRTAIVIGAGGAGREIAAWLRAAQANTRILGFLDGDASIRGAVRGDLQVLGSLQWLADHAVDDVVIGVGASASRRRIAEALAGLGVSPTAVIHPTATIGERASIAPGAIIAPGAVLTVDVRVDECAYLNYGVAVGHDTHIEPFAVLAPRATIAGNVRIGRGAEIGIGASAIQGVEIGEDSVVGGGACVVGDIPPSSLALGVPARVVRRLD